MPFPRIKEKKKKQNPGKEKPTTQEKKKAKFVRQKKQTNRRPEGFFCRLTFLIFILHFTVYPQNNIPFNYYPQYTIIIPSTSLIFPFLQFQIQKIQ
jgi:hypothetical protein